MERFASRAHGDAPRALRAKSPRALAGGGQPVAGSISWGQPSSAFPVEYLVTRPGAEREPRRTLARMILETAASGSLRCFRGVPNDAVHIAYLRQRSLVDHPPNREIDRLERWPRLVGGRTFRYGGRNSTRVCGLTLGAQPAPFLGARPSRAILVRSKSE